MDKDNSFNYQAPAKDAKDDQRESARQARMIINEVQLLLSEKRTALSVMRTGIAVFALPMSVLSILIATSRNYNVQSVIVWLILIGILCVALTGLGIYLIARALKRLHKLDRRVSLMKSRLKEMPEWVAWS